MIRLATPANVGERGSAFTDPTLPNRNAIASIVWVVRLLARTPANSRSRLDSIPSCPFQGDRRSGYPKTPTTLITTDYLAPHSLFASYTILPPTIVISGFRSLMASAGTVR